MKKRKTKRWISGMTAAVMLAGMMPMAAFAAPGQWPEYQQTPQLSATSSGVTVEATCGDRESFYPVDVNITINRTVDANTLDVNLTDALNEVFHFGDPSLLPQPGDKAVFTVRITNNSNLPYDYNANSVNVVTQESTYNGSSAQPTTITAFDGFPIYLDGNNNLRRIWNKALEAIGIAEKGSVGDAEVSDALKKAGYSGGIEDLDNYYVDYYNTYEKKAGDPNVTDLTEVPMKYLEKLFAPGGIYAATGSRETNPDVAAMGYYYFYGNCLMVDDAPLTSYMLVERSDAYKALDAKLTAITLQPGESKEITFTSKLQGWQTSNCFQNYLISFGASFSLIQGEPKTDYPSLDKTIITPDGNKSEHDDVAAGDTVHFQLESNVPNDIINYMMPDEPGDPGITRTNALVPVEERGVYPLTFHDDLNQMFVNPTNFVVKIGDKVLSEELYTLQTTPGDSCDFEIALDLIMLYDMGYITDQDIEKATPITVEYDATLSTNATAGTYENAAWVTYPGDESEKDIVQVDTYALDIYKYDQANPDEGLAGAEFTLTGSDGTTYTAATGTDGHARIEGLDAGTYTLTETKAPEGYVKSDTPLTIEIPEDTSANVVSVQFANSEIPHTGGMGTILFTIGGAAIIVGAGIVFAVTRKRKKAND